MFFNSEWKVSSMETEVEKQDAAVDMVAKKTGNRWARTSPGTGFSHILFNGARVVAGVHVVVAKWNEMQGKIGVLVPVESVDALRAFKKESGIGHAVVITVIGHDHRWIDINDSDDMELVPLH